LALIVDGEVQLGVTGCPNFPIDIKFPDGEKGCLFVAEKGQGAFQVHFFFFKPLLYFILFLFFIFNIYICVF